MPSPPPPYSPEGSDSQHRIAVASPMFENFGFTTSPLAGEVATRHSPQVPMSPAFPPPPPQSSRYRERSSSGLGGQRSLFSFAGIRGKQPVGADQQQPQVSTPTLQTSFIEPRPPAARRAASTGHIHPNGSAASSSAPSPAYRGSPDVRWQPGMPLPPPPPGPPPAGARSQSLNRIVGDYSGLESNIEAPRPRRVHVASTLGPVPPTPAGWTDQEPETTTGEPAESAQNLAEIVPDQAHLQPLRIETGVRTDTPLTRRPAKRDSGGVGIRERRSRSRATKGANDIMSPASDDKPTNLVFSPVEGAISRRREHMRSPNFGGASSSTSPETRAQGRPEPRSAKKNSETVLTPPYTPAVGKSTDESARKLGLKVPGSASSDRPISHLLHAPNDDSAGMPAPLSPARPASSGSMKTSTRLDAFSLQAMERHRTFVEKEAAATSDEERLELFANFIVHESRLRRDRYAVAYNAMAGEIVDLTRDLWRSFTRNSRRAATPSTSMSSFDPTLPSWASDGQPASAHGNIPSSASSFGEFTPGTDIGSAGDPMEGYERTEGRQWAETFKPSLSPIPSMAVSTVQDEGSSRGRTASRWWEQSQSGSGSIGRPDRMEKSRRETKYMGVSAAALADEEASPALTRGTPTPGASSSHYQYGPDEYPPEKVGWHENAEYDTPIPTPHRQGQHNTSRAREGPLDVSRLVTLPPPHPRHHPAVNNSHPLLADVRNDYRQLAQSTEIQKIKDEYLDKDFAIQRDHREAAKQRRNKLRSEIQSKIADGELSFADAAKAESDFDAEEAERGKTEARSNFDVFETSVSHPLNTLLTEGLNRADECIKKLRVDLESGRNASNPNQAQEEGDEHPERLEKLTLLKWIFESRELLHKEMCDLHAMRSDKYSEVILTPYRIAKAQSKIDEATAFFAKDSVDRQITFAKDSLKRFEELQVIVEKNVTRGVEDQLSAFWDIAPGLSAVIQHIPSDMNGFEIQIPQQEYEENPSYHEHPMQYLYSLINHAEKSAYQFIESQTNLLCLMHEVRTATTKSSLRLVEIERNAASPDDTHIHAEMIQARKEAEGHLTEDLKEKVGEVERQWKEALGVGIEECKTRVRAWLAHSGGLEDELDG